MGDAPTGSSQAPARHGLIDRANAQDLWVREIVRQVLASRPEFPAAALDSVYATLLAEKELSAEAPPPDFALSLGMEETDSLEPLRLGRLGDVERVNALTGVRRYDSAPDSQCYSGALIHALLENAMRGPVRERVHLQRLANSLTVDNADLRRVVPEALDTVSGSMLDGELRLSRGSPARRYM